MKLSNSFANQPKFPFSLPKLPYEYDSLVPHVSADTIKYHYTKHHQTYVDKLNDLLQNYPEFHGISLEDIINTTCRKAELQKIFNNAAQIWNHSFYWHCMSAKPTKIDEHSKKMIENNFSSYEKFCELFQQSALNQFGSGWCWLVLTSENKLEIIAKSDAYVPFIDGNKPILTIDVWEHAYYLDYQNRRVEYIKNFINNLINWHFVKNNLENL